MTTATASTVPNSDTHNVCIDLPGETVQCWSTSTTKIKVTLRKHRDVVFDIQLFKGMVYSIEADQSDFYDTRAKKLVHKGKKVSFQDGERMHFWVGRDFKGHLILKANGKALHRYSPSKLDPTFYDEHPKTKAAPIIVALKNDTDFKKPQSAPPPHSAPVSTLGTPGNPLGSGFAPTGNPNEQFDLYSEAMKGSKKAEQGDHENHQQAHVHEINHEAHDLPEELAHFFKSGGEETAIDPGTKLLTRNWLFAQITAFLTGLDDGKVKYVRADIKDIVNGLRNHVLLIKKVLHKTKGIRWYVIFQGTPALWKYLLTSSRSLPVKPQLLTIKSAEAASEELPHKMWGAAKEAGKESFKHGGLLTIVFTVTLDYAEWLEDHEQIDRETGKPKKDLFDLLFKIGLDFGKAWISAALGAAAVSLFLAAVGATAAGAAVIAAAPVAAIVVGTVLVTIGVAYLVDLVDNKTGTTVKLNKFIREKAKHLEKAFPSDYNNYENALGQALLYGGMGA